MVIIVYGGISLKIVDIVVCVHHIVKHPRQHLEVEVPPTKLAQSEFEKSYSNLTNLLLYIDYVVITFKYLYYEME